MDYLERHAAVRGHPDRLLDGVRSVVMVSVVYGEADPSRRARRRARSRATPGARIIIELLWDRLERAARLARRPSARDVRGRAVADTAPLLERDFARLAGLGWIGKNTMLIDRRLGSFTVLGALLVDLELVPDPPHAAGHCGTCTRCLDACPTDAFAGPYQLDARRCISYWTIEHKGPIAEEFADQLDGWVFGCDVCQDVCPWNRKAPAGRDAGARRRGPDWTNPDLIDVAGPRRRRVEIGARGDGPGEGEAGRAAPQRGPRARRRAAPRRCPRLVRRLDDADEDPRSGPPPAWALGASGPRTRARPWRCSQDDRARGPRRRGRGAGAVAGDDEPGQPGRAGLG